MYVHAKNIYKQEQELDSIDVSLWATETLYSGKLCTKWTLKLINNLINLI